MRTAVDVVLEGVSNGSITNDDAKILLEAINQKGGTQFVPLPYENPTTPYPPHRPGDIWYTSDTTTPTSTSDNKSDIIK